MSEGMIQAVSSIHERLIEVEDRIARAAAKAGRGPGEVKLVVVTKAQPLEVVQAAVEAGAKIIGENYPEESVDKISAFSGNDQIEWHMIGHLQSRKAKIVVENFQMLQSLDSLHLAEKLERLLIERQKTLPVLIEVNTGGEESKAGWPAWDPEGWSSLMPDIKEIMKLPHLKIAGLMTMPPLGKTADETRPYFIQMRRLQDFLRKEIQGANWNELSMGTSVDFESAVEEGATLVRVGKAIVGSRPKKIG